MLLAIDIGNTSTMIGICEREHILHQFRLRTNKEVYPDELGISLINLLNFFSLDINRIDDLIISNVVPEIEKSYHIMAKKYLKKSPLFVGVQMDLGMPILYKNRDEIGADRIVNAIGGFEKYKRGLIIVDFGTAITADVVTPEGEYLGGSIAPGFKISVDTLFVKASKLTQVEMKFPERAIGTSTEESLRSGIFYGFGGLVDGLVGSIRSEIPFTPFVIATGGYAHYIVKFSKTIETIDENLTIWGLMVIYKRLKADLVTMEGSR